MPKTTIASTKAQRQRRHEGFLKLIEKAGSRSALSKEFGIERQAMTFWEKVGVPLNRLKDIERLYGISRQELRPDIFE